MTSSSHFSAPFIRRPVATSLITIAILLSGVVAFRFLPVAPLPEVDFPTISVGASLPGASPETMASAVATPLERQFGRIAGVTQMTSSSGLGSTSITLQFDLNRDINAAARDVQACINAARTQLPADLPGQPTYRKVNPADAPILILSLTSDNIPRPQIYDAADSILAQKLAQVEGVGQVFTWGSASPAVRVEANPYQLNSYGISLETVRASLQSANSNLAKGDLADGSKTGPFLTPTSSSKRTNISRSLLPAIRARLCAFRTSVKSSIPSRTLATWVSPAERVACCWRFSASPAPT